MAEKDKGFRLEEIAYIHTDFPAKFGIPRQSGLADTKAEIVFAPKYRSPDACKGLEEFSHLWLIWGFSGAVREKWSPTVRPPRLGGNKRVGCLPAVPLSALIRWGCPAWRWKGWRSGRGKGLSSMSGVRI